MIESQYNIFFFKKIVSIKKNPPYFKVSIRNELFHVFVLHPLPWTTVSGPRACDRIVSHYYREHAHVPDKPLRIAAGPYTLGEESCCCLSPLGRPNDLLFQPPSLGIYHTHYHGIWLKTHSRETVVYIINTNLPPPQKKRLFISGKTRLLFFIKKKNKKIIQTPCLYYSSYRTWFAIRIWVEKLLMMGRKPDFYLFLLLLSFLRAV